MKFMMASPYVLWQYFNLMLPHKQSAHMSETPVAAHASAFSGQQILGNSQQSNFANLHHQYFQHHLMQQYIGQASSDRLSENIFRSFDATLQQQPRQESSLNSGIIADGAAQGMFQTDYISGEQRITEKCITPPVTKHNRAVKSPRSPRRSLFTIDAILAKNDKEKALQSPISSPSHLSHPAATSNDSYFLDSEASKLCKPGTPPASAHGADLCSPLQDRRGSLLQPLMHSTPHHCNPSYGPDFSLRQFLSIQPPSHIYSLHTGHHQHSLPYHGDANKLHEQQPPHDDPLAQRLSCLSSHHHHHHHQQQQQHKHHQQSQQAETQLQVQSLSSSSPSSTSASSSSGVSSNCSDMSISSSGSTPQAKPSTDKQTRKSGAKSKRVRTIFTPDQLERLEAEFERQQYMVGTERFYLASSLNLSEAQVKVWFQNRRIKWRKQHLEQQQARLARGDLYKDLDLEEGIEDSPEDSDMEEDRFAPAQTSTSKAGFRH